MKARREPLDELPPSVDKFRAWTIKQRSMAKRRNAKALLPLVYVPPPPIAVC